MVFKQALKNISTAIYVAVRVGQFSSSVSCVFPIKYDNVLEEGSSILEKEKTRIQTISFPSSRLGSVINSIKGSVAKNVPIKITINEIEQRRHTFIKSEDLNVLTDHVQIKIAVEACNFGLVNVRDEAYIIDDSSIKYLSPIQNFYPHILILFGNKIMFVKVYSTESYECVGEHDIAEISKEGNTSLQLDSINETIELAKSFLSQYKDDDVFQEDLLNNSENGEKSKMSAAFKPFKIFCDNLGHLCTLHAKRHKINQVIFGESLSNDIIVKQLVTKSIGIHSDNSIKTIFLRHERYLESIGTLLSDPSIGISQTSWTENYCESSALETEMFVFEGKDTYQLTLDSLDNLVTFCPVLSNSAEYIPDIQNLSEDSSAREYWLDCISEGVNRGITRSVASAKKESVKNLEMYKELALERLEYLRKNPDAYGYLTMRILQDTLEHIKREMGLITMYEKRKQHENATALKELVPRLECLDSLDCEEKQIELVKYLLAGNMFDWGAKEVAQLMMAGKLNFQQAMDKLAARPWLIDDLDSWTKKFKEHNYKSVMIFADNSGYDLVLGVLPFVREFLRRGAKVVICANCEPIINDITYYEMNDFLEEIKNYCPILKKAIEEESLSIMKLAKSSCCLDLCFVDIEVAEKMKEVTLLIIEGMGRAIHTNLYARFKCDTLRVGVIKDHWLSRELGGDKFSCRKQHENATALKELVPRLECLDSLDCEEKQIELVKYLLAGNMFDWGAKEVAQLMMAGKLNFQQAMDKLAARPWLIDDLDSWTKKFKEHNYKSVMIFADNSGYDLVLGVLPFVREFLRRGAKVVICANCEPIINDITYYEMNDFLEEIKNYCPILKKAIEEESLSIMKLAKSSCCLDLCFVDIEVAEKMKEVTLLIIEGMGRAIHTNLYARFKCDTLRVGVIKDHWLSRELGGDKFSCVCKFSRGDTE